MDPESVLSKRFGLVTWQVGLKRQVIESSKTGARYCVYVKKNNSVIKVFEISSSHIFNFSKTISAL